MCFTLINWLSQRRKRIEDIITNINLQRRSSIDNLVFIKAYIHIRLARWKEIFSIYNQSTCIKSGCSQEMIGTLNFPFWFYIIPKTGITGYTSTENGFYTIKRNELFDLNTYQMICCHVVIINEHSIVFHNRFNV